MLALLLGTYLVGLVKNNTLNFDSNILSLLPATEADPAVEQAFANFSEQSMRRLVLLVANADKAKAKQSAEELASLLQSNRFIAEVELKRGVNDQTVAGDFYYQHRHHLLSKPDAALLGEGNFEAFSEDAIQQAYAPFSGGLIGLIQNDPFLLSFRNANTIVVDNQQGLTLEDGYLIANDNAEYYVLLTAELNQSPFDQDVQQDILAGISALEADWSAGASGTRLNSYRRGVLCGLCLRNCTQGNNIMVAER